MSAPNDPLRAAEQATPPDPFRTVVRRESDPLQTAGHIASDTPPEVTTDLGRVEPVNPAKALPQVPGYAVEREIARGGMGVILAARDLAFDREVAIKLLLPGRASPAAAARFVIEAKVTGQLAHPGVPPVHQLGSLPDGSPFLAMKLIRGQTLSDLLKARPSHNAELPRFVQVFEQIGLTVGFAHSKGFIHRDLKPLNVMVGAFGEVQVMDWGLARAVNRNRNTGTAHREAGGDDSDDWLTAPRDDSADGLTQAGQILGTPSYMAPEQARGEIDKIDARSDVFALGGILCAVLTGQPPFVGPDLHTTIRLAATGNVSDALTRLDTCDADPELVALARRCLAPDPAQRPAHGKEVADAVAEYRTGVEQRLQTAERDRAAAEAKAAEETNTRREAEARVVEQRKKRKFQLAALALVGLLLAAGGGFAWWRNDKHKEEEREKQRIADKEAGDRANTVEAIGILLDQVKAALAADDIDRAASPLAAAEKRAADGGIENLPDDVRARLAKYRLEFDALKELDAAYDLRFTVLKNDYDIAGMLAGYRAALRKLGIVPGETPPEEVARIVRESLIADRLLMALDQMLVWGVFDPDPRPDSPYLRLLVSVPKWRAAAELLPLLRAADPDPFRDALRAAVPFDDGSRTDGPVATLAARKEALQQPGRFAVVMTDLRVIPRHRMLEFLEAAYLRNPTNWRLGRAAADGGLVAEHAAGSLPWLKSAVALRPNSLACWLFLATAHANLGDLDRAEACYREAAQRFPASEAPLRYLVPLLTAKRRDLVGALVVARELVARRPNSADAHDLLGYVLQQQGDHAGAIPEYRQAIELKPDHAHAHFGLGRALLVTKDYPAALDEFQKAVALAGRAPRTADERELLRSAREHLGYVLFNLGHHADAIPLLREAIQEKPNDARTRVMLGCALRITKDVPGALVELREAVRLDPVNAIGRVELGRVLRLSGDLAGALLQLRVALRLDPNNADAFNQLGNLYYSQKDYTEAARYYRAGAQLHPDSVLLHSSLAHALWHTGDKEGAVVAWKETARLGPTHTDSRQNLAVYYRDRKEYAESAKWFREWVTLVPTDVNLRCELADVLNSAGRSDDALAEYKEAMRRDSKHPLPHHGVGWILLDRKDYRGAVAALREAVELDPKNPGRHYALGTALRRADDTDGALAAYREALKIDPKRKYIHYAIADVFADRKDWAGAAAAFREVLKFEPDDAVAHQFVGHNLVRAGDLDGAATAYREAIRCSQSLAPFAWANLGDVLHQQGKLTEAEEAYRTAARLDPKYNGHLLERLPLKPLAPPPRPVGN